MLKSLNYMQLKKSYTLEKIESLEKMLGLNNNNINNNIIIGQETAIKNLEFGFNIKNNAYNIYIEGDIGTGRTFSALKLAEVFSKNKKIPDDLIYVYNFKNPNSPRAIYLPPAEGEIFKNQIENFIYTLSVEIPKLLLSKDYEEQKDYIFKDFNNKREAVIKEITLYARTKNLGVRNSNNGIYFMPIIDGVVLNDDEYDNLDFETKDSVDDIIQDFQDEANKVAKVLKNIERDLNKSLDDLEYSTCLLIVGNYIASIQQKYIDNLKITSYLCDLKEDILDNISNFIIDFSQEDDINSIMSSMSNMPNISSKSFYEKFPKYNINLLVDNSRLSSAPVVIDYKPSYSNLVGEIQFESELGNLTTDYMKIKSGLLHKANGGYLILHVDDILKNNFSLETIIKCIKTQEVIIEPLKDYNSSSVSVCMIEPEPTPIDIKFILIGSSYYYDIITTNEEQFQKYFKIHAIFDYEIKNNDENILSIIKFIKNYQQENNLLEFDTSAIIKIIEHISRLAGTQGKLSAKFDLLIEILIEANAWALSDNISFIGEECIKKTISNKYNFIYNKKLEDMILNNDILIKTSGLAVGEINGLSVLDYNNSYYCFGKPSKITVTTYKGNNNNNNNNNNSSIIDIERESYLSGDIHTKGINIITGYLGRMYAKNTPLSFSCRICFEQNYNGVDGDSASSTELYGIISSLSGLPIRQDIAVTGSVNQMGEIQPIGGVSEKIEGFFNICDKRGLTGKQGVIIPVQNVKDLCLNDEVINAVKNNMFNIYAVCNIDEGLEILLNHKAGDLLENGRFTSGSIHDLAMLQVEKFNKIK